MYCGSAAAGARPRQPGVNAVRHSPDDQRVSSAPAPWPDASNYGSSTGVRDCSEDRDRIFVPFQRLGDNDNTSGLGLGLALSRGLAEAMGGTLTPEDTPGGGLTMVLALRAAPVPGPGATGRERPCQAAAGGVLRGERAAHRLGEARARAGRAKAGGVVGVAEPLEGLEGPLWSAVDPWTPVDDP